MAGVTGVLQLRPRFNVNDRVIVDFNGNFDRHDNQYHEYKIVFVHTLKDSKRGHLYRIEGSDNTPVVNAQVDESQLQSAFTKPGRNKL